MNERRNSTPDRRRVTHNGRRGTDPQVSPIVPSEPKDVAVVWTEVSGERCILATAPGRYIVRMMRGAERIESDSFLDEIQAFATARRWRRRVVEGCLGDLGSR